MHFCQHEYLILVTNNQRGENDFVQACSDRVDGDDNGGIKVLIGCRVDETNEQTEGERTKCMNRGACINETQEKGGGVQQNTQTGENESP